MTAKLNEVQAAIADSWDAWLNNHDVSVPDRIEVAVTESFAVWLETHSDSLIAAIAERAVPAP